MVKTRKLRRKLRKTRSKKHHKKSRTHKKHGGDLTSAIINGIDKKKLCITALSKNPETRIALGMNRIEKGCDMLVKEYASILPEIEEHPEKAVPIIMKHMFNGSTKLLTSFANNATNGKFSMMQNKMLNVAKKAIEHMEPPVEHSDEIPVQEAT
jgi:hypothetical protein